MPRFVLISMVKNEEKILRRCLESVEGLVDAYVITDTGSIDTTTEIAMEFLKTHDVTIVQQASRTRKITVSQNTGISRIPTVCCSMQI